MEPFSVTYSDVLSCQFHVWYPRYKKQTIKSRLLPLTREVCCYLESDSVKLPNNVICTETIHDSDSEDWSDQEHVTPQESNANHVSENSEDSEEDSKEEKEINSKEVQEFCKAIDEAIQELGGFVFPKLNWSAPVDASWIATTNSLKCQNVGDVLLLMKTSDFVAHDFNNVFDHCEGNYSEDGEIDNSKDDASEWKRPKVDYYLALRKWSNLVPSREFRCFVVDSKLVGICQRDNSNFYAYLSAANTFNQLQNAIFIFFNEFVKHDFPRPHYVMDVYVDKEYKVWLIDFNVFGPTCNSLLFSYPDDFGFDFENNSRRRKNIDFEFRIHRSQPNIAPSSNLMYRYPTDLIDLSSADAIEKFTEMYDSNNKDFN